MRQFVWMTVSVCSLFWATYAEAQTRATLTNGIHNLALDIKDVFKNDPRLMGQSLQLGKIDGKGAATKANFGTRLEQMLRDELVDLINDAGKFTLTGGFRFDFSDDASQKEAKIIRLTVRIDDERDKEVKSILKEINDTDEIFQILGLTGAPPQKPNATFLERNKAAQDAQAKPDFDVQDKTRVSAKGLPQWSMSLLKKATFDGPTTPVVPQNVKGLAFVPIDVNDYYEIELANNDLHDAVATISVDGLDVANTFSVDKDSSGNVIHWPGFLVPKGQKVVIRGWLHTIDQSVKDNVFSFLVGELGQGAATALKTRGTVGVITVQFREAVPPGEKLTGRSFGETQKGEGLRVGLKAVPMQIGENVLSTVSIRYNRPE